MARAIARDPKIILFDEANGGLDSAADEALREALLSLKGKCTIIIVSHRPSLLNIAERRFRLLERRLLPEEDCRPAAAVSTARIEVFPDDEASDAPSGDKPREAVR